MKKPAPKPKDYDDTGFAAKNAAQGTRLINRDGTFNVTRRGVSAIRQFSIYQYLVHMPWWKFHLIVLSAYFIVNCFFAAVYFVLGVDGLAGMQSQNPWEHFWEVFFFSAQTLTTVGFGRVSPVGIGAGIVSSIESLTGLMGFALATGLLYGRFSRASPHLVYSENALVSPYRDGQALMFRFANVRTSVVSELSIQLMASWVKNEGGREVRKYLRLPLERERIDFLTLSWTVVHPLDENSPIYGMSEEEINAADTEFIIILKAYDETFAQNITHRHSYKYHELVWNARFVPAFHRAGNGEATVLELDRISDYEMMEEYKDATPLLKPDVVDLFNSIRPSHTGGAAEGKKKNKSTSLER